MEWFAVLNLDIKMSLLKICLAIYGAIWQISKHSLHNIAGRFQCYKSENTVVAGFYVFSMYLISF